LWRKFKPSQAEQDRVSDAAGAPFKAEADAAHVEWMKLQRDPNSTLDQRDAAFNKYQAARGKETEARRIAREAQFYGALDRMMEEYASNMDVDYYVEDWD
jgi:Skp family chaperone for outer membrane proteins